MLNACLNPVQIICLNLIKYLLKPYKNYAGIRYNTY